MPAPFHFRLHGTVRKQDVEQLFPSVVAYSKSQLMIVIDGREIAAIDLEAISALCGIHRYVANRGLSLRIDGVKTEILEEAVSGNHGFSPWAFCSNKNNSPCLWARI